MCPYKTYGGDGEATRRGGSIDGEREGDRERNMDKLAGEGR